ncbi:DegT/DnrJ/EryC1/StrS family aminotransferase [Agrococcus carbonis]|uniref:dTDP-4-amino-4,6-dideoxygalactose transaminase n=1 Tax=Agrococcus carbonis TaxID=684552 RepID=A0A1H1RG19_9MICO|nr:aminotransferase class I/II-fold pyridoxal phosphate-dependent enzyme [Agrococcus carbonis]SDS34737.1 dTDP-4-amino-4,6-dideoxygalactose transaminase [Agrococcus carbonis]
MSERIHLSAPDVGAAELAAIVAAFDSGWIAPLGPDVDAFERELADRVGVAHAVALASGTAALHLGLLGMGARPGTAVVTSTMTFAATANAICYTGAEPVFVDCDPVTGNLDPTLLEAALRELQRDGVDVAAIVPVDLLGRAADYSAILPIARRFGLAVLSDAAESLGASHGGRRAGSLADASVFSFNGNKIATTSGGGMLLSDDAALIARARHLATQAREPARHYEHAEIGFNYRLSNLLAAMGRAQLARLDAMIARRRAIRERYRAFVAEAPGIALFQGEGDAEDNCWLTAILLDAAGPTPTALAEALDRRGIEARPLWKPMHRQPAFRGRRAFLSGAADRLFSRGLALPSGSALDDAAVDRVLDALSAALAHHATGAHA